MENIEPTSETETLIQKAFEQKETRLPTKTKQELIPYEKDNYSTIEKAIIELSEELGDDKCH